ncbi:MAG: hypothetical protein WC376_05815 [Candidatus Nanoarchaeia archaeon]|jgi:hypothetical protein
MDLFTFFLQNINSTCVSFLIFFGPLFFFDNFFFIEKISKNMINKKNEKINELKNFKSKIGWKTFITFHENLHINNNYLKDINLFLNLNYNSGIFLIGLLALGIFFGNYNIIIDFAITMLTFLCIIFFVLSSLILLNWYFNTCIKEKTSKYFAKK